MSPQTDESVVPGSGKRPLSETGVGAISVADAAVYRGIIEDFSVSDGGKTVLNLIQVDGTNFGAPTLKVMLDDNTQYAVAPPTFGNGSYVEVYYGTGTNPDGSVTAAALNELLPVDMILFNGIVAEVTPDTDKTGSGSILVDPLEEGGMQFLFFYRPETVFTFDLATLKVGDKINVVHSAAATRSIPPQSNAYEIHLYLPGDASAQIAAPN